MELNFEKSEEEGGCGVIGLISSVPVSGKVVIKGSIQMHNRGNGKGGGIAAIGLLPEQMGVSKEILENDYLLNIAIIDPNVQQEIEENFIKKYFDIHKTRKLETIDDYKSIGLEVKPPDVMQYFVRVKKSVLKNFIKENPNFNFTDEREIEDEFVYRNSFKINKKYYASLGEKKAFVLSHGRNMMILKIVGYAEQVIKYYKIENLKAHIWIAHQRYPTRGKIWHPGGSHPFNALNEALVHNGDFANYHSIYEYLIQRNYQPLFLTDTEEATLLFDLWNRIYKYPLEYLIEAFAPTSEMDFDRLPEEKQKIYRIIQQHHVHCSPDGPWFFIIARNNVKENSFQLIGITDTSMLRPQVFSITEGEIQVGVIASEKQAIDATLHSLSEEFRKEGKYFVPVADKYWNARGGSHTDGGAFIYTLKNKKLICTDKFGNLVKIENKEEPNFENLNRKLSKDIENKIKNEIEKIFLSSTTDKDKKLFEYVKNNVTKFGYAELKFCIENIKNFGLKNDEYKEIAINALTLLNDLRYDTGKIKRSWIIFTLMENLYEIFSKIPKIDENKKSKYVYIDFEIRNKIRKPENNEEILVINGEKFQPEGDENSGLFIANAYKLGWKKFIIYNNRGQRFIGCGLGPKTKNVRIDVYGSSGDYLGSGIDGMEIYVHGNAQDQLGQIMKSGKLVIYGDVGQTFMYGAKGGEVYVMGNAAGRPLINAVGCPRVVINGTALDYLAESFMAGDPLNGGGFVILNGITFDENGKIKEYETPYPGSNLFSLASGGAIYVRDPHKKLIDEQLNGGEFVELNDDDVNLIKPYLEENEKLFNIKIDDLLTINGEKKNIKEVYRKIVPKK